MSLPKFLKRLGIEMREMREKANLTQDQTATTIDLGKDSISKMESGRRHIKLHDYLTMMYSYRDIYPNHPGVALAKSLVAPNV